MKGLFILLIVAGLVYGGSIFLKQSRRPSAESPALGGRALILTQTSDKIGGIAAVLGESISGVLENGEGYLSDLTGGASEPIINKLISNTQEALKDLPKKEAEKIKYEFCKGVVSEYEKK